MAQSTHGIYLRTRSSVGDSVCLTQDAEVNEALLEYIFFFSADHRVSAEPHQNRSDVHKHKQGVACWTTKLRICRGARRDKCDNKREQPLWGSKQFPEAQCREKRTRFAAPLFLPNLVLCGICIATNFMGIVNLVDLVLLPNLQFQVFLTQQALPLFFLSKLQLCLGVSCIL